MLLERNVKGVMGDNMAINSYISPKAKVKKSKIEGLGLFVVKPIKKGEIVAIKGGHIMDGKTLEGVEGQIEESYIQIEDNYYIGAMKKAEVRGNKMFINHSCDPNVGIRGQISFVAMRNIRKGEELTYDWVMENPGKWSFKCNCGGKNCRMTITGNDWELPSLQKRYKGFFSAFIQEKFDKLSKK